MVLFSIFDGSFVHILALEIKPCGLGSRIRDMEAEWRLIKFLGESLVSRTGAEG